jgi:hypothetical protein
MATHINTVEDIGTANQLNVVVPKPTVNFWNKALPNRPQPAVYLHLSKPDNVLNAEPGIKYVLSIPLSNVHKRVGESLGRGSVIKVTINGTFEDGDIIIRPMSIDKVNEISGQSFNLTDVSTELTATEDGWEITNVTQRT